MRTKSFFMGIACLTTGMLSSCEKPKTAEELRQEQAAESASGNAFTEIGSKFTELIEGRDQPGEPPFHRVITDSRGRKLEARVFAKSDGHLAAQRLGDGAFFSIPLGSLSENDQAFFAKMPDSSPEILAAFQRAKAGISERRARWLDSVSSAEFEAKKYQLPIFLLFTGSDWCPPCIQLESRVLGSREFQDVADQRLVLAKLEVPRGVGRSADLKRLMTKHSVGSFPTAIILSAEGKELGRLSGYSGVPAGEYLAGLAKRLP